MWFTLTPLISLALAGDLQFGYTPSPQPGEDPAFMVTPPRDVDMLYVHCDVGGEAAGAGYEWEQFGLPGGVQQAFSWPRDERVTSADCFVRVRYQDKMVEEFQVPVTYAYSGGLSVEVSEASVDLGVRGPGAHTLTVQATAPVTQAQIVAYGAHRAALSEQTVGVAGGPGPVSIPWTGDPSEVVLLEVRLSMGGAWADFTFSPWHLEIPHDDVLFPTGEATITADQEHKLEHTLGELRGVLDRYGAMVPVQLYIAGCTDTVGDAGANRGLSARRARAIAAWMRDHGYDQPIHYYGFGEGFLAQPTGDEVDSAANRRALYLVGASPPPASTGVPQVVWITL